MNILRFLLLFCLFAAIPGQAVAKNDYPDFKSNPYLDHELRDSIKKYLLPVDHPAKAVLDTIFFTTRAVRDEQALLDAGFVILFSQETSYIKVVSHPLLPGYVMKLNLDSETRLKKGKPAWYWLANRCKGAKRVRDYIRKKKLHYFDVPDKWVYILPSTIPTDGPVRQPILVIETDMQLVSHEETKLAWKTVPNEELLDQLYYLLKHGCGSRFLTGNIPYTKNGKFAFIDTEYPKRKITLSKATEYFSDEMQAYWLQLID